MKINFRVKRQRSPQSDPYYEEFEFETTEIGATVAFALNEHNKTTEDKINWECSCFQKKCGACAMRINSRPVLACDFRLENAKGGSVLLEPLKKFPVIADLVVDRSVMFENLKEIGAWLTAEAPASEKTFSVAFESGKCLQCGCCLEVCPNFFPDGKFFGMATAAPVARLLAEMTKDERKSLRKQYGRHFYNGCGKSLACRDVCPAGIETERLMVNSNAISLWKQLFA